MEVNNLVLIEQFCMYHQVEFSFINSLHQFGLIEVVIVENNKYLSHEQLKDVEKMVHFHYELNINLEGIDAISNLLKQIKDLQQELCTTKNKLGLLDSD